MFGKRLGVIAGILVFMFTITFSLVHALGQPIVADINDIYINEIMAVNATILEDPDEPGEYPDWFEIYNAGIIDVDLNGFYLSDDSANPLKYLITDTLIVPAGSFVVFYADNDPSQGVLHTNFRLTSAGEDLLLTASDGLTTIDSYTFFTQTTDISEGRLYDADNTWYFFSNPTPGSSNNIVPPEILNTVRDPLLPIVSDTVRIQTTVIDTDMIANVTLHYIVSGTASTIPMTFVGSDTYEGTIPVFPFGVMVSYYVTAQDETGLSTSDPVNAPADVYSYDVGYRPPDLTINEFMAENHNILEDPEEPGEFPDWIEIYNATDAPVDLLGFYLTDSLADLTKYHITQSVVIPAHDFIVFYADRDSGQGILHTNFALNAFGESVALVNSDGVVMIDSYTFSTQDANISIGRMPDGGEEWRLFEVPTPGSTNALIPPRIYNLQQTPTFPSSGQNVQIEATITDDGSVLTATIHYSAGTWLEAPMVHVGDNQYEGFIPGLPNNTEVRYYVSAIDNDTGINTNPPTAPSANYHYLSGYTPPNLRMNEFMASNSSAHEDPDVPGTYPDWIEIYNDSDNTVNLSGMYLTDDLSNPTKFRIPAGIFISAHDYIVFYADGDVVDGNNHTNFSLSANGESIGLFDRRQTNHHELDTYTYGLQITDVSEGWCSEGWQRIFQPTPGWGNSCQQIFVPMMMVR